MITRRLFQRAILACSTFGLQTPDRSNRAEQISVDIDTSFLGIDVENLDIAFSAIDLVTGTIAKVNGKMLDRSHSPWSSFKIPNLIIALEMGVARDLDHWRRWDRTRRPAAAHWPEVWQRDHTLRTAFRQSVPWYFQDVALEVGVDRYRASLEKFSYGNRKVLPANDSFWLGGPLAISVNEQVSFVEHIVNGALSVAAPTYAMLREVSLVRSNKDHSLYGKTGAGALSPHDFDGRYEGWFVGWSEQGNKPKAACALYVRGPSYNSIRTVRLTLAKVLLVAAGHLPTGWT